MGWSAQLQGLFDTAAALRRAAGTKAFRVQARQIKPEFVEGLPHRLEKRLRTTQKHIALVQVRDKHLQHLAANAATESVPGVSSEPI
jgi:hypothetical protein